jgi:putative nucleotidyltransferase with HDIG domain
MMKNIKNKKEIFLSKNGFVDISVKKNIFIKYIIGIASLLCVILIVSKVKPQNTIALSVGEIAPQDIRAIADFKYADKKATDLLQEQAVTSIPSIYRIDPKIKQEAINEINSFFAAILDKSDLADIKQRFDWADDDISLKVLLQTSDPEQLRQNVNKLCNEIFDKGVISNSLKIRTISSGKDTLAILDYDTKTINDINVEKFIVFEELNSSMEIRIKLLHPFDRHIRQAIKFILLKQIKPNVIYDSAAVEQRREESKKDISPIYKTIKTGQIIVRRGDPFTEAQKLILLEQDKELNKSQPKFNYWTSIAGNILLISIFFIILVTYLHFHQPEIFSCNKRLFLLSVIIISTLILEKMQFFIPVNVDKPFFEYFILLPVGAILIAILMDKELAILSSMIMGIIVTIFAGRSVPYIVILMFGSIIAIQITTGIAHRWKFLMAGVFIGTANVLSIIMVNLLNIYSPESLSLKTLSYQVLGGFTSGLACAIIVDIYMPVLEKIFNITTDFRLLELSDLNHPLLKMMVTEAPGTYHHSIMVSNMAEDAAFSINANPLLAKVGGYFHDIGKTTKPEYFVENTWFEQESRHEKLFPTMSNLVITAHVKDGIHLARKYRLPTIILDIISEHHGTSLVYYFYKKAEKASIQEGTEISETDFRYVGPRPHTKEAGIIMLADVIEAASHTLVKPTPGKIEDLVDDITNEKIEDNQLDDCGLTLKDISIIKERFTHILTGILHKRIEYPDKNEDQGKQ